MDARPSPRADLISALVWFGLSAVIVYLSWTMDRLENQNINPYTAPGLVPGMLGLSVGIMALMLFARSLRGGALRRSMPGVRKARDRVATGRFLLTLSLCLGFAGGLVGRGAPFWLATVVFVTAFIVVFQFNERRATGTLARGVLLALACGASTAAVVTIVFQEIFLVRLP